MLKTVTTIYSLLIAVAILLLGSGLLGTTIALRSAEELYSETVIGLIMSGFFLGYVVGAYICPRIIRRVGHIRTFAAMAAIGSVAVILHGLILHPLFWWVLRVISGICMLGMYLVIESWLNAQARHAIRGRIFALYMLINLAALGSSQFLILIYGVVGLAPFALVALFFSLALVPVALTRVDQPPPVEAPKLSLGRLSRISPLGTAGALISGLVSGAFWGLGPIFADGIGMQEEGIALFMSAVIFGGALLQWPVGHLSDHRDRRAVLAVVALLGAVAAFATFGLGYLSPNGVLIGAALFGGFAFTLYSLSVAHTNDHIEIDEILVATRGMLLLNGIGATIGPILAGPLMDLLGNGALMLYFGTLLLMLGGFALWRMRTGVAIAVEDQAAFVTMTRTTPMALELDPRTETEQEQDLPRQP